MKKLIIFLILSLCSCDSDLNIAGQLEINEISRIASPDKKVDAVLIESETGATTSTGYHLFLVKKGKKISEDDLRLAVFTCDHQQGLKFKWAANRTLVISYLEARIFNYQNSWNSDEVDNWNYIVEVFLDPQSKEHQLSAGDRHINIR